MRYIIPGFEGCCSWTEATYEAETLGGVPMTSQDFIENPKEGEIFCMCTAWVLFGGIPSKVEAANAKLYKYLSDNEIEFYYILNDSRSPLNEKQLNKTLRILGIEELKKPLKYKVINQADFPIQNVIWLHEQYDMKETPKYDIVYGGGKRPQRQKSFDKYLVENNLVSVVGSCYKQIPTANVISKRPYLQEDYIKLLNDGYCTLFITDNKWKGKWTSWRLWESWRAATICFIDEESDPTHSYIDDEFFYIKDKDELMKKCLQIKSDENLRKRLIDKQIEKLNSFDYEKFRKDYEDFLKTLN